MGVTNHLLTGMILQVWKQWDSGPGKRVILDLMDFLHIILWIFLWATFRFFSVRLPSDHTNPFRYTTQSDVTWTVCHECFFHVDCSSLEKQKAATSNRNFHWPKVVVPPESHGRTHQGYSQPWICDGLTLVCQVLELQTLPLELGLLTPPHEG